MQASTPHQSAPSAIHARRGGNTKTRGGETPRQREAVTRPCGVGVPREVEPHNLRGLQDRKAVLSALERNRCLLRPPGSTDGRENMTPSSGIRPVYDPDTLR